MVHEQSVDKTAHQHENRAGKALVIVPTYNEADNVPSLIPLILEQPVDPTLHVLIVDDGSPDGTAGIVKKLAAERPGRVHLIERAGKMGLGTAYVAGFRWALEHGYDFVFEMDADFSHNPETLPEFFRAIENHDVVLGSRYLTGVTVVNWPLERLILSYGANTYTRIITGLPLKDGTGGFKCFRREALAALDLDKLRSDGYGFQIEVSFILWKKGFRITEIPIVFQERRVGISKMSRRIVWEAAWLVWRLRVLGMLGRFK